MPAFSGGGREQGLLAARAVRVAKRKCFIWQLNSPNISEDWENWILK